MKSFLYSLYNTKEIHPNNEDVLLDFYAFDIKDMSSDNISRTVDKIELITQELDKMYAKNKINTSNYIDYILMNSKVVTDIMTKYSSNLDHNSLPDNTNIQRMISYIKGRQKQLELISRRQTTIENMMDKMNGKSIETKLVKSSLHYQLLRQGKDPIKQPNLFDEMFNTEDIQTTKITVQKIGLDLGTNHTQAIHAIQKMLNMTNYLGNSEPATNAIGRQSPYHGIIDYLPSIRFTPAEFLEAYGLKKNKKNQYNRNERDLALKALRDLNNLPFALFYQRINPINQNKVDLIKQIKPLISITEGYKSIDPETADNIISGADESVRITYISIAPHPVLVDQLDSYFVWKPADCYTEIKLLSGTSNKYMFNFVDYLITEFGQRNRKRNGITNTEIRINYLNLAYKLQMESLIKTRQWKRIKSTLISCYDVALKAGYLINYSTMQEGKNDTVEVFTLNPEKFGKEAIIKREKELKADFATQDSK